MCGVVVVGGGGGSGTLFLQGGSVTGTVMDTVPKVSPIPEGGLEVPLLLHVTYSKKRIIKKMKEFVNKQITRLEDEIELHNDSR